jgi:hypothetical protein
MRIKSVAAFHLVSVVAAGAVGVFVGQAFQPKQDVHAQDQFNGVTNCVTSVPKAWGDFKGGSTYGLAFQDNAGVVRFILHPSCGSLNSPAQPPVSAIDLRIDRQ